MLPPARDAGWRRLGGLGDALPILAPWTSTERPRLDLAALAASSLSPVSGRYMDRSWSHGDRPPARGHVGPRVPRLRERHRGDRARPHAPARDRRHPRAGRPPHPAPFTRIGFAESTVTLARILADTFPDPLDTVLFLNSGSEAIDGALKLARRVSGRPGIIAFRGAFHGRTIGATSVTTSNLNYRTGYEPLLPAVYFAPFPTAYREFGGDERPRSTGRLASLPDRCCARSSRRRVAAILIETVQGEGGYYPLPRRVPARASRAVRRARHPARSPTRSSRGFGRTGEMWGSSTRGSCPTWCAWRRPSPTACRCRRS